MDFEALDPNCAISNQDEAPAEPELTEAGTPRKRRRRRKLISPAHEARIEAYRAMVEDRGWIFSPPSPTQPVSVLLKDLTDNQVASLSA